VSEYPNTLFLTATPSCLWLWLLLRLPHLTAAPLPLDCVSSSSWRWLLLHCGSLRLPYSMQNLRTIRIFFHMIFIDPSWVYIVVSVLILSRRVSVNSHVVFHADMTSIYLVYSFCLELMLASLYCLASRLLVLVLEALILGLEVWYTCWRLVYIYMDSCHDSLT